MESFDDERTGNYSDKARESDRRSCNTLEAKMAELKKTKEKLKRAKDNATESWLDSKPLIDELERLKSELTTAQNQNSVTNNLISELESQLETIVMDIRAKREEELKAVKMANEMNGALERTREELERLETQKDEERRARSKLKLTLRLRRQTLQTLRLTLRAAQMESEAFRASAAEALRYIDHPERDNSTVELTQKDFYALKRRAKEETSLANWRVSIATEQKAMAEAAWNSASKRLKETQADNRSRGRKRDDKIVINEETKQEEAEDQDLPKQGVDEALNNGFAFPKARAKAMVQNKRGKPQWMSKPKSRKNKESKMKKKRKLSILFRIKICLVCVKRFYR